MPSLKNDVHCAGGGIGAVQGLQQKWIVNTARAWLKMKVLRYAINCHNKGVQVAITSSTFNIIIHNISLNFFSMNDFSKKNAFGHKIIIITVGALRNRRQMTNDDTITSIQPRFALQRQERQTMTLKKLGRHPMTYKMNGDELNMNYDELRQKYAMTERQ